MHIHTARGGWGGCDWMNEVIRSSLSQRSGQSHRGDGPVTPHDARPSPSRALIPRSTNHAACRTARVVRVAPVDEAQEDQNIRQRICALVTQGQ